jgi:hypothetical protein
MQDVHNLNALTYKPGGCVMLRNVAFVSCSLSIIVIRIVIIRPIV